MGYWREYMRGKISEALKALPTNPSKEEIATAIKNSYPFSIRENHPYKIWLSEKREFLIAHGIKVRPAKKQKTPKKRKPPTNPDGVVDGQLRLFDF
jgi:hypothetical protein